MTDATVTTVDTLAVDAVRAHYGKNGPALMGALKADGFSGRTLAERAAAWYAVNGQPAAAPAVVEPTVPEHTDDTDTDLEPVAEGETVLAPAVVPQLPAVDADAQQRAEADASAAALDAALAEVGAILAEPLPAGWVPTADEPAATAPEHTDAPAAGEPGETAEPTAPVAHPCRVCGQSIGWDAPSGVCSAECLNRGQGFSPTAEPAAPTAPAEPLPMPEPELIPAGEPAAAPVALAPIPAPAPTLAPAAPIPAAPVVPVVPMPAAPRTPTAGARSGGGDANLYEASRQWAERPADERYWTVADALDATRHHKETAREVAFDWTDAELKPSDDGRDIVLALPAYGIDAATLTNYSARQLCASVGAPHSYLAKLPTDLAADCLRAGLVAKYGQRENAGGNALVHQNGTTKLRSINSDRYARFWNCEVFEALMPLVENGWRTPPARPSNQNDPRSRRATAEDVLTRRTSGGGLSINVGDWIAPAGIYASSHDMFAFLVNESVRLDDGTDDGLARGFFISNSEVGAAALKLKAFYYRHVCGNHIVWGAEEVIDVSIRHVGTADSIRQAFKMKVSGALDKLTSATGTEQHQRMIDRARTFMLTSNTTDPAAARKEVLDALIRAVSGNRTLKPASGISVGMFDKAISAAVEYADTDRVHPYSLWGAINGLTRYSQSAEVGANYADERARVDALVPKLLQLVADPAAAA